MSDKPLMAPYRDYDESEIHKQRGDEYAVMASYWEAQGNSYMAGKLRDAAQREYAWADEMTGDNHGAHTV